MRLAIGLASASRAPGLKSELAQAARFRAAVGAGLAGTLSLLPADRKVLVWSADGIGGIVGQFPLLMAFRAAGYLPVVLMESRNLIFQRAYQRIGCDRFVYLEDVLAEGPHQEAERLAQSVSCAEDLLTIEFLGTRAGKFALSTLMRYTRQGDPDLNDPETRRALARFLSAGFHAAAAAEAICERVRPDACLLNERGYTPFGQLFDAVLARGGFAITWNAAHRNDTLMLKRYHAGNVDQNHFSLSPVSWNRLKAMPWSERHWQRVRDDIFDCYRTGQWFSECGTQVGKTFPRRDELSARLGLRPGRKTCAIFPHMFWDATFFWGVDVFRNYEDWFIEALKGAGANRELDWIVKIHPANVAKDRRDNFTGQPSELVAIRKALGPLPDHIKVIPAESDISTQSLYELIDVCLTVRGTAGIEAACAGISVVTAGTGRYDRLGFTIDPSTPEEYRQVMSRLHEIQSPTPEQVDLARRFAYGVFAARPLSLESISFGYDTTTGAALKAELRLQQGADPLAAGDVRKLTQWLRSGDDDFLDVDTLTCAAS
jgi:hypothetical protein